MSSGPEPTPDFPWMSATYIAMLQAWLDKHPPRECPAGQWTVIILLPEGKPTGNSQLDRVFNAHREFNLVAIDAAQILRERGIPILWARYNGLTWDIEYEADAACAAPSGEGAS